MKTKTKIEGLDDLHRAVDRVVKAVGPGPVEPLLLRGAENITQQVQANVDAINKVTGNLSRSPVTKQLSRRGKHPATAIAAIDRGIAPHAWLVEFKHGQQFFRPAVDAKHGETMQNIKDGLRQLIEGAAR